MNFTEKAKEIYEQNKLVGWWDDPDRCIYTAMQLISTEIAEATEGERKNLMDDHLPHRRMGEVELADALIRLLDLAGRSEWDYLEKITPLLVYGTSTVGRIHLGLNRNLCKLADIVCTADNERDGQYTQSKSHSYHYSTMVDSLMMAAKAMNYDIIGAMEEKLEYNRHRQDHKRENREKENGKKF
ncbi:MAG: hypothetical protein ACRCVX_02205 [Shewanella sp.]